jgi:hypothetical protein
MEPLLNFCKFPNQLRQKIADFNALKILEKETSDLKYEHMPVFEY